MTDWVTPAFSLLSTLVGGGVALLVSSRTSKQDALLQRQERAEEWEWQRQQRAEERSEQDRRDRRERRDARYTEFFAGMRYYYNALRDYALFLDVDSERAEIALDRLEEARGRSLDLYFHAQMILPDQLLAMAREVNGSLNNAYKHLTETSDYFPSSKAARDYIADRVGGKLWPLRDALRADLDNAEAR